VRLPARGDVRLSKTETMSPLSKTDGALSRGDLAFDKTRRMVHLPEAISRVLKTRRMVRLSKTELSIAQDIRRNGALGRGNLSLVQDRDTWCTSRVDLSLAKTRCMVRLPRTELSIVQDMRRMVRFPETISRLSKTYNNS
jgi:hypothetical protein